MKRITKNGFTIAVLDKTVKIKSVQDTLDLMADVCIGGQCTGMILYSESLEKAFFDLKTGFAGEILQKFSNYYFQLAIIGDFSVDKSKSLKDFIYECNQGRLVFFKSSLEAAVEAMLP